MKERPILMSAPMVRAILDGRKTVTRRIAKGITEDTCYAGIEGRGFVPVRDDENETEIRYPYGVPGDRLWVRETWALYDKFSMRDDIEKIKTPASADGLMPGSEGYWRRRIVYRADNPDIPEDWKYRPSIFMPRWASRITLEVTGVRVERLHCITESDAKVEGFPIPEQANNAGGMSAGRHFEYYWRDLNGDESWTANPFVWVVEFRRVTS